MTHIQMDLIAIDFRLILHDYMDTVFCVTLKCTKYFINHLIELKLIEKYVKYWQEFPDLFGYMFNYDLTDVHLSIRFR